MTENITHCGSTTVTLTATGSNNPLTWYSDAQGNTALDAPTQNVTTTTTYYVASTDGHNCRSALVPLTVTIHDVPAQPVLTTTTLCKEVNGSVTLDAGQGNYHWYTTVGGTPYPNPYTANNAGAYYVTSYNEHCESAPLAVTVLQTPSVPSAEDVTLCAAGTATLAVNNPSSDYTYTWYRDANLGSLVGTGASVNVNVTADATYYVTAANGTCASTAKAVAVTIRESIDAPNIAATIYACDGSATLPATYNTNTLTWKNANNQTVTELNLTNVSDYTAFQMDVVLPNGMTIVGAELSDRAGDSHKFYTRNQMDGSVRMLASSVKGETFSGNEGAVLYIDVETTSEYMGGNVELLNILFSDVNAQTRSFAIGGDATGISLENADVNGDGEVSIADVTILIDYLLTGTWP